MFDERALKELASVETEGPILSMYLNVDSTQRTSDEYKLELRELLKVKAAEVDSEDIEAVKRYVEYDYDWSGRGLVIFSRQAEGIWYAYSLAVPVRSGITVARRPYISPLVERDGLYGRYAVALVDRQGGRFFFFQMGELVDQRGSVGEDVHHTRRGRGSSVHGMRGGSQLSGRREAELVMRNLRETAAALVEFCQEHRPRRLLLGGAEPTVAKFREVLPSPVNDLIVGTVGIELGAGEVEVREQSFELLQELEEERHERVVDAVMTSAAKGLNGVVGLDQTLSVANEGRVQVLLVERDYHQAGYRCTGCGYLTTQRLDRCVFCGGDFHEIPDAVEAAVTQVVEKGGTVEVVGEERMEDTRIGALLRY
jgi:hypothetical protein